MYPKKISARFLSKKSIVSNYPIVTPIQMPVSDIRGVGPKIESCLNNMGIYTIGDLLFHLPINVVDWKNYETNVSPSLIGVNSILLLTVTKVALGVNTLPSIVHCIDSTGQEVRLTYFAYGPFVGIQLKKEVSINQKILVRGKLKLGFRNCYEINSPERRPYTDIDSIKAEAVYRLTEGIAESTMKKIINEAFNIVMHYDASISHHDWLSKSYLQQNQWLSSIEALRILHDPTHVEHWDAASKARERLAFDELVMMQVTDIIKQQERYRLEQHQRFDIDGDPILTHLFEASLPFALTPCQQNATKAIFDDMRQPHRMKHLLQGDVGSGKSVVSFLAMLRAIECGKQALLLAPTDILAKQHLTSFGQFINEMVKQNETNPIFSPCPQPKLGFLSGDVKGKVREQLFEDIQSGKINVVIGTHALLSDGVFDQFDQVGLVVIDEEQRFGVEQRNILADRANTLMISATPIPRTHLLFMQRGHKVSELRVKPKRKRDISTIIVEGHTSITELIERIKHHIPFGTKVFWVCASLHPSASHPGTSAMERYQELSTLFPGKVGLIHGQMPAEDKQAVMDSFSPHDATIQILVSTTVIEVGIDVPDVSLCVIDRADRYGLSQLHQIRGRIGRGPKPTNEQLPECYCMLVWYQNSTISDDDNTGTATAKQDDIVKKRLMVLKTSNDGFEIAEADLRIRGPGDVFGIKQSGTIMYRIASLPYHHYLLSEARTVALHAAANTKLDIMLVDPRRFSFNAVYRSLNEADTVDDKDNDISIELVTKKVTQSMKISKSIKPSAAAASSTVKSSASMKISSLSPSLNLLHDPCLLIALDFEATGFSTNDDRIIEIGACVIGDKHRSFNAYINPGAGVKISPTIESLTGISRQMLDEQGQPFHLEFLRFLDWIEEQQRSSLSSSDITSSLPPVIIIAHNGKVYDFPLLRSELKRSIATIKGCDPRLQRYLDADDPQGPWLLDSLTVIRLPAVSGAFTQPKKGLAALYEFVTGTPLVNAHSAIADVHALDTVIESQQFRTKFRAVAHGLLFRINDL